MYLCVFQKNRYRKDRLIDRSIDRYSIHRKCLQGYTSHFTSITSLEGTHSCPPTQWQATENITMNKTKKRLLPSWTLCLQEDRQALVFRINKIFQCVINTLQARGPQTWTGGREQRLHTELHKMALESGPGQGASPRN